MGSALNSLGNQMLLCDASLIYTAGSSLARSTQWDPASKQTNIQTKMVGTKKISQQVKAPATKPNDVSPSHGTSMWKERTPRSCLLHSIHIPWHIQKRWGTCTQFSGTVCTVCQALSLISSSKRTDRNHLWLKTPKIYHLAHFRKVCYSWYSNIYL